MAQPPVVVLASRVRVEEKRIFAALDRARISYLHLDTRQLVLETSAVSLPYAAALSREISHTRATYACRLLESAQVCTVNTADVIATCGDKLLTSLVLARHRIPTPRTSLALTPDAALPAMQALGFPVVIKPLVGSWGRLQAVVRDEETARTVLEHRAALPSPQHQVIYIQELIDKPGRDIRVVVVGEQVLGATYRHAAQWRTNVARGGQSRPCPLFPELTRLARTAAEAVGGGVLGVDLVEDGDGRLHVLEVNHTLEFAGFQDALADRVDVAAEIVAHLRSRLAATGQDDR